MGVPHWRERFWARVQKGDGCWEWTGKVATTGYGRIKIDGREHGAHRVAYRLAFGEIPEGLQVHHRCENRRCVRPEHLEAVTIRTNVLLGRGITAVQARQRQCKRGHEFTPANTYVHRGLRHCRACRAQQTRELRSRKIQAMTTA